MMQKTAKMLECQLSDVRVKSSRHHVGLTGSIDVVNHGDSLLLATEMVVLAVLFNA